MTLTNDDLKAIQKIVDEKKFSLSEDDHKNLREMTEIIVQESLNLEAGQTLDDKLSHFPTKEEFYSKEDEVLKELKTVKEEMQILNGLHRKVNQNETQIEKLEKIHPNNKHPLVL